MYEPQYIDCSRLRGPGLSSVLEYARAVGAGGGGVGAGRVVVALPSPLGPAAAAQLTRSGSLGLSNFRGELGLVRQAAARRVSLLSRETVCTTPSGAS